MIDSSTFAALFDDWYPKLYAFVRSRVPDLATAEDITASTFERAYKHSHSYDPAKGSFEAWLFQIARNLLATYYTARSREPVSYNLDEMAGSISTGQSPEQQLLWQEQHRHLLQSIAGLPDRDQEIIQLRFFGRLTNRKIAEVLDLNEKTVSVIIYRTLKKLRSHLSPGEA